MSTKKVLSPKNSILDSSPQIEVLKLLEQKFCGAFLLRGSRDTLLETIKEGSDYTETIFSDTTTLGIDEVRKQISQTDYVPSGARLVVFSFYHITLEAQNALLKFLEEPPSQTTILLVTGKSTVFLPTVLSRVQICQVSDNPAIIKNVQEFLDCEPAFRMELTFIKKMLLAKLGESNAVDKEAIHQFLDNCLEVYQKRPVSEFTIEERQALENSLILLAALKQNGASAKQILEYIALALK